MASWARLIACLWVGASFVLGSCAAARPRATIAGAYRFHCEPSDARVLLDEVDQGACRVWQVQYLGVSQGSHRLRIERDGYLPHEQMLQPARRRETVRVLLRERPD